MLMATDLASDFLHLRNSWGGIGVRKHDMPLCVPEASLMEPAASLMGPGADPVEQLGLVLEARRELLLRVHRHRLGREDLEDCLGQATVELLASIRGGRRFASSLHMARVMANYLRASGAPADYRRAIFAYNHAWWYVEAVLHWARLYGGAPLEGEPGASPLTAEGPESSGPDLALLRESTAPVVFAAGVRARLYPGDGHVATIPIGVPAVVQAMVAAGNELQALPYGPDGHPDPLGAPDEDCSSTVNFVLYRAGIRPLAELLKQNPLAQSYIQWGASGPGRWVTIYATASPTPHVFMVIAGLRLDTSYEGTDIGPNRHEGGPRWRLLDHIPTWAHWSVRHPPGL